VIIIFAKDFVWLCVARLIGGLADAVMYSALPIYLGEVTTPRIRGTWGNGQTFSFNAGFFLISALGRSHCQLNFKTGNMKVIRACKPWANGVSLIFGERTALKRLNQDKGFFVLPADNENVTVIISTTDYEGKIKTLLDPITYKKLPRDPSARRLRNTN